MLESKQAAEEDARIARTSLRYEVTTAKVDDEIAEQARLLDFMHIRLDVI